jgi:hypothetical protein
VEIVQWYSSTAQYLRTLLRTRTANDGEAISHSPRRRSS